MRRHTFKLRFYLHPFKRKFFFFLSIKINWWICLWIDDAHHYYHVLICVSVKIVEDECRIKTKSRKWNITCKYTTYMLLYWEYGKVLTNSTSKIALNSNNIWFSNFRDTIKTIVRSFYGILSLCITAKSSTRCSKKGILLNQFNEIKIWHQMQSFIKTFSTLHYTIWRELIIWIYLWLLWLSLY